MNFSLKHLIVVVAIAAGGFGLAFALSDGEDNKGKSGPTSAGDGSELSKKGPFARLCRRLQCTPEQIEALLPIVRSYRDDVRADVRTLETKRRELARAFKEAELDEDAITELHATIADLETRTAKRALQAIEAMHPHLTPGQREVASKLLAKEGLDGVFDPPAAAGGPSTKSRKKNKKKKKAGKRPRAGAGRGDPGAPAPLLRREPPPREDPVDADPDPEDPSSAPGGAAPPSSVPM